MKLSLASERVLKVFMNELSLNPESKADTAPYWES